MMNKRERTLESIRVAAYHGDDYIAFRLYAESRRISRVAFDSAMFDGRLMKQRDMRCECYRCKEAA